MRQRRRSETLPIAGSNRAPDVCHPSCDPNGKSPPPTLHQRETGALRGRSYATVSPLRRFGLNCLVVLMGSSGVVLLLLSVISYGTPLSRWWYSDPFTGSWRFRLSKGHLRLSGGIYPSFLADSRMQEYRLLGAYVRIEGRLRGSFLGPITLEDKRAWKRGGRLLFSAHYPPATMFLLSAVLMAPFCMRLALRSRKVKTSSPSCTTCGYDLRGSVSAVCSECGTPIVNNCNTA